MARRFSNKLAAKQVTAINKPGKHSDGNGLYLLVKPKGNRSWVLLLIGGGQRREMGLGTPETVSLAAARKLAAHAKAAFAQERNPIAERVEARPEPETPIAVVLPGPKRRARSQGGVTFWSFAEKLILVDMLGRPGPGAVKSLPCGGTGQRAGSGLRRLRRPHSAAALRVSRR